MNKSDENNENKPPSGTTSDTVTSDEGSKPSPTPPEVLNNYADSEDSAPSELVSIDPDGISAETDTAYHVPQPSPAPHTPGSDNSQPADEVSSTEEHGLTTSPTPEDIGAEGSNKPVTIGGQAVLEGVMIRAEGAWAVACRKPSGEIEAVRHPLPHLTSKWKGGKLPLLRGILVLGEAMTIGVRALSWSAQIGTSEEEKPLTKGSIAGSLTVAFLFFAGVFILAPALVARWTAGGTDLGFNAVEAVIRLGLFVGYIWLIGRSSDIRRVFQYHGAEHMTIHAFEAKVPLTMENIKRYSPAHPRCGTSFLLLVVVLSILVFSLVGRPGWLLLIASRVLLIPVIASLSYELLRFAGLGKVPWLAKILSAPGLWLQRLTTGQPDDDQIEVAVVSMLSSLEPEQVRKIRARGGLLLSEQADEAVVNGG